MQISRKREGGLRMMVLVSKVEMIAGDVLHLLVLTREKANGYACGHLTRDYLKDYVAGPGDSGPGDSSPGDAGPGDSNPGDAGPGDSSPGDAGPGGIFYLCGPPPMMDAAERHLYDLGVGQEQIVKEGW